MNPELLQSLTILGVGMITVFSILGLVVATGKGLIAVINRITSEEQPSKNKTNSVQPSTVLSNNQLTAIVAAVDITTKGKGKVTKIEKL